MERAILLMFLLVSAVAGPAEPPPDISYQRLQVVTPANPSQSYQSFSKSLEAYSVRTIMFMYPKDRMIVQYQFITGSGAGNVRYIAGGRQSNFLTIRAENSGARVFNYMVHIYTMQVATTTESLTTITTTESDASSEPDSEEGDDAEGSPEEENENSQEEDDDSEGSGLSEEDDENSPEADDDETEGSGTTPAILTTACVCTCD